MVNIKHQSITIQSEYPSSVFFTPFSSSIVILPLRSSSGEVRKVTALDDRYTFLLNLY